MSDFLEIDRADAIWTIRLNRPDARNAIDPATARELAQTWTELDNDPEARVAVITGSGTAFCAGGDLRELGEVSEVISLLQRALLGPARISKPVIAAANGAAVGGGLSLLLACDLRIAADTAWFSSQAARLGLYPFGQVNVLTREIGLPAATELLFTARRFGADEALRLGILGEVVEPERLMTSCLELAGTIAANAPLTVSAIKRTYAAQRSALMASEQDAVVEVLSSADAKEGALSFLELSTAEIHRPLTTARVARRATGPRARRSHADVVAAAALVFARKGYAEATVEDIADELGILKGSLYHNVRSKSELLYEVVREPVQEMVDSLEKILATDAPADRRLDEFIRMHVATLIRHFPNLPVYLQERFGAEAPADSIRQLSRRYQTLVELLVADGIREGVFRADVDTRLVASTLLGSLNWMHKWIRPDSATEPAQAAETILAVTIDGLRPRTSQHTQHPPAGPSAQGKDCP